MGTYVVHTPGHDGSRRRKKAEVSAPGNDRSESICVLELAASLRRRQHELMGLGEYKAKRDFRQTKEPAGWSGPRNSAKQPMFVVQKHDATRLHYDFRLEMEGVLKSWAVPKGFPTARGDRRLAVQVEDHPIDYADFEGTIPEGNYGAGTVMVWDTGTYETGGGDPMRELKQGKLHLFLHGKKLKSEWTLVRMRSREENAKPQWLLLKSGQDVPAFSQRQDDQSVLTRRSMNQIARESDRQWGSNREGASPEVEQPRSKRMAAKPGRRRRVSRSNIPRGLKRQRTAALQDLAEEQARSSSRQRRRVRLSSAAMGSRANEATTAPTTRSLPLAKARFIEPMKALLLDKLPRGSDWTYEVKFDGVRALGIKRNQEVELVSRSAKDLSQKYHSIAAGLRLLPTSQGVLDGEIVALDESGRSSFQLLQTYQMPAGQRPPLVYYVFDILNLDGEDLTGLPLEERKRIAESLLAKAPEPIRLSPGINSDSEKLMREMQARGLEGLIAKRRDSKYEAGRRSGAWVKFKWTNEQEFVIAGYTPPKGTRTHFGALLVGYYESRKLMFAARVGTGFDQKLLALLHAKFQKLIRKDCPFANLPEKLSTGISRGFTGREMRTCTWLEPQLVCQIRFAEWTRDGHLRQPAFLGLRDDKKPQEVVRERAQC